ncbi:hypothetical protein J8273_7878 [Carpediemonas membranifera]|uniref:Uncharacterized protein n=1 Tax=Carpediemonas membranifera TaxID=201153 RepID=A0A8J6B0Q6_9EUKA|nr:hypothetical protein J8273_7878 [Carpediemonas membranifera]|eukprot:KAG9390527.1 hypothetical protein J8273_7878 [Carpediemonas membranifera]
MKLAFLALLLAIAFAAQFTEPMNGDKLLIDQANNVTFPLYTDNTTVSLWFEFQNDEVKKVFDIAGLTVDDYNSFSSCVNAVELNGTESVDLTLPIDYLQLALDAIDDSVGSQLPFDIPSARDIVNNVLQNIDAIPEEYRNMTIALYPCSEEGTVMTDGEPDYQSWVIVDSARLVAISVAAVIAAIIGLL